MPNQASIGKQKFVSIDIMRGIAILMVILVHTAQGINGLTILKNISAYGQMGVQLFFIASAFTLCYSLDVGRSKEPLLNFYIRRYFRIAPGYYVGIIIYLLIDTIYKYVNTTSVLGGNYNPINILVNMLFLHGIFPPANNNVVPGGWSIGTEMLFYLIFPALFGIYRFLNKKIQYSYIAVPFIVLSLSLLAQGVFYFLTGRSSYFLNNGFVYYSILSQLPVFCLGVSTYFAFKEGLLKKISLRVSLFIFISLSIVSAYLMVRGTEIFVLINTLTPFISGLSFVFLFVVLQYGKNVQSAFLEKIGVLSYSCYLLHFIFAVALTRLLLDNLSFFQADVTLIIFYLLSVGLTYFSAKAFHVYIEQNGIRLGKRIISSLNKRKGAELQPRVQKA